MIKSTIEKKIVIKKLFDSPFATRYLLLTIHYLLFFTSIGICVAKGVAGVIGKVAMALFGFDGSQSIGGIIAGVL